MAERAVGDDLQRPPVADALKIVAQGYEGRRLKLIRDLPMSLI